MKNNFKIKFYKSKYGWWNFTIKNNKQILNKIRASYRYSPLSEYVEVIKKLIDKHKEEIVFEIDQEGFSAILTFLIIDNGKNVSFTTYTDISEKNRIKYNLPLKTTTIFNRKQLIKEMKKKFKKSYLKNKKELTSKIWNNWYFDFKEFKKLG